jgi:hypothetical protein
VMNWIEALIIFFCTWSYWLLGRCCNKAWFHNFFIFSNYHL